MTHPLEQIDPFAGNYYERVVDREHPSWHVPVNEYDRRQGILTEETMVQLGSADAVGETLDVEAVPAVDYEAQLQEVAEFLGGYEEEVYAIERWLADQVDLQEKQMPAGFDEVKVRIAELGRYLAEIAPTRNDRRLQEAALHMKHFEEIAQAAAEEEKERRYETDGAVQQPIAA